MNIATLRTNLANPQRTYLWQIWFDKLIGGGNPDIKFRAQASMLPGRAFGDILVPYMQTAGIRYPGKMSMSHDWTIQFVEGEDGIVQKAFYAWHEAVIAVDTGKRPELTDSAIKTDAYLQMLGVRGSPTQKYVLRGVYCKTLPEVQVAYEQDQTFMYSVTLSFDDWEKA
jgi:hypothetical protein